MLALETSCEGAARVCNHTGIQVSGDTIIRILKKRFSQMKTEETSDCIGIASPLNNGFVEGINNRNKMIKRVMYGRCGVELLAAKIMLPYAIKTDI